MATNPPNRRVQQGKQNYQAGLASEQIVRRHYEERGATLLAERWRGKAGEIDLIFRNTFGVIFVEVKSSRNFSGPDAPVSARQIARIAQTAEEFISTEEIDPFIDRRLDVALVDQNGHVECIENVAVG